MSFNSVLKTGSDLPMDIREYQLITDNVSIEDVTAMLSSYGDVHVMKHGSLILFKVIEHTAYALDTASGKVDIPCTEPLNRKITDDILEKSRKFVSVLLAFIVMLTGFCPVGHAAVSGRMSNEARSIEALNSVSFKTASSTLAVDARLVSIEGRDYTTVGYTFNDPRPLERDQSIRSQTLDSGVNTDKVTAILLYDKVNSFDQIIQTTGLNVTGDQLDAAIQLSLWKTSMLTYKDYQVQESSIGDAMVRSLSTAIDTWADNQVKSKPQRMSMAETLIPKAALKLNAGSAERSVTESTVIFGPYTVTGTSNMILSTTMTEGFLVNLAGEQLVSVKTGEQFFIVLPITFGGTAEISLQTVAVSYSLAYSYSRVWVHQTKEPIEVKFNVSTTVGSYGVVEVQVVDSMTNLPVENVGITIKNETSAITSSLTNGMGKTDYSLPVGAYTVSIAVPHGFLPHEDVQFRLEFIGDVRIVKITIARSGGIVNFFALDAATLADAGYSEAYIYKDGEAVKRLALNDGSCLGISLPAGNYVASIYKTSGTYSVSGPVAFTVADGVMTDINLSLVANTPKTTVRVSDTRNKDFWTMTFYHNGDFLFSLNTNGTVDVRLDMGHYQVIAETNDGVFNIPLFDFSVAMEDQEVIIPTKRGEHSVVFNFVDTILKEPIPSLIVGLYDQNHSFITHGICDVQGRVVFHDIEYGNIYYVNIISGPSSVSGYSANGNRFLGSTREYTIQLFSAEEISSHLDPSRTFYPIANLVYQGTYQYPNTTGISDLQASESAETGEDGVK